jgi:uncharacterized RDD family membrane protein YckC
MRYKKREESFLGVEPTLATIPARFIAMMIDLGVIMLIFYLIFILLKWFSFKIDHIELMNFHHIEMKSEEMSEKHIQLLKILLGLVPTIYFTLIMYFTDGQTIGKRILGIKIVSVYHHRISFWHCLERSLGYIASTLEVGLGFLQVFWNPNRMALHDRIAETIVIRTLRKK